MSRTIALMSVALFLTPLPVVFSQRADDPPPPLQLKSLRMPAGFSIAVYADQVSGARSMTLAPDGTIFVGTRTAPGSVYAVVDRDNDHKADAVVRVAEGLNTPNGVAFKDGTLYVAELNRVVKFDGVLEAVKSNRLPLTPSVVNDTFPSDRPHGWKYLAFGPDGWLYLQVGAPCNICDRPAPYASILRMKPDGSGLEVFARGVRNSVGMAWHPDTKDLWFTDNGRDMLGDEQPNDELNHAPTTGLHFGYPYCHEGSIADPEFGATRACGEFAAPAQKLGPHVASLGLLFYKGRMFPAAYRKQIIIAQHGSWNRTPQAGHIGYRLMVATLEGNTVVKYEPLITGWLQGRQAWGRPVDLLELPDGSVLISDDRANVIYRLTYQG